MIALKIRSLYILDIVDYFYEWRLSSAFTTKPCLKVLFSEPFMTKVLCTVFSYLSLFTCILNTVTSWGLLAQSIITMTSPCVAPRRDNHVKCCSNIVILLLSSLSAQIPQHSRLITAHSKGTLCRQYYPNMLPLCLMKRAIVNPKHLFQCSLEACLFWK